jgi:hypothetical protein
MRTVNEKLNETVEQKKEQMRQKLSERKRKASRLMEAWEKRGDVGKTLVNLYETDKTKAENLVIAVDNQEKYLQELNETQISTAFSTTPENVVRIITHGYPNSVRGEIFLDWMMETSRDSIYYLHATRKKALRGVAADSKVVETADFEYPRETVELTLVEAGGTYTGDLGGANNGLRAWSVRIYDEDANGGRVQIGGDDGQGNIIGAGITNGAVNYDTGAVTLDYAGGLTIVAEGDLNTEIADNYDQIGDIEMVLRDVQFRSRPRPLYVSWSKMTELLLGTTLKIDAEETLVRGAGEELKKSLDFHAINLGWRTALSNASKRVTFDATKSAGETERDRTTAFSRKIREAGSEIFKVLLRGGVTKIVGDEKFVDYLVGHDRFSAAGAQPTIGAHKVGSIDNIDIYKAPEQIIQAARPAGTAHGYGVYKNENNPEDVSIAFGTLIPLYETPKLEFKEMYSEKGIGYFGDAQVLQKHYIVPMQIDNIS